MLIELSTTTLKNDGNKNNKSQKIENNSKINNKNELFTSQKNSFPRSPQNHEIQETSSELLIFL